MLSASTSRLNIYLFGENASAYVASAYVASQGRADFFGAGYTSSSLSPAIQPTKGGESTRLDRAIEISLIIQRT